MKSVEVIIIDQALVARGRAAYRSCVVQHLGSDSPGRETGVGMIPGAIVAAIGMGIVTHDEIVPTAARVSKCWESTVGEVLDALSDPRIVDRLWRFQNGRFELSENADRKPVTIIAN